MAEQLEAILLRLGLDASGFTKGARDAKKELGGLEKGVSSLKGEMGALVAQAAAGIGLAALVHEAMEFSEAVIKVRDQTGLSIEAIQFLRLAADQTGTSVDALAGTVNKLQRQLVDAGSDDKLRAELEALVGPIEAMRALQPEQQLQKVAEAVAGLHDPAERSAAAVALLGKSGADSIPELLALAQRSDELTAAFQRTGGAVSEQAITAVEGLGDSLGEAKTAVTALATELLGVAAPALSSFLTVVTEVIGGLRLLDGMGDNAAVNLSNSIDEARTKLQQMEETVAGERWNPFASYSDEDVERQRKLVAALESQMDALHGIGLAGAEATKHNKEFQDLLTQHADEAAANLMASLTDQAAIEANFAALRYEALAAELDEETQLRMDALRARHEMERLEEQAQVDFLRDLKAAGDADMASTGEALSDLKISTVQQETSAIAGLLQQQTEGVARHSKAAFEINKAAGIVNTTVNTIQAITKAWADYGWPIGAAIGAAIGVAGAAQVSAIASQKFGSGGGAPSQAAQPATPVTPAAGAGGGQAGGDRVMRVQGLNSGDLFKGDAVRQIAAGLLEFQKDGGQVVFQGN